MQTDHQPRQLRHYLSGTAADRWLLLLILLLIAGSWAWIRHQVSAGPPTVYIYHEHRLLAMYPLPDNDQQIHYRAHGHLGISDIMISRHGVRMLHSPCSSQRCVLSGEHIRAGDMIACVPNHILVSIRGNRRQQLDAIAE